MAEDKLTATLSLAHQISADEQGIVDSLCRTFSGGMKKVDGDGPAVAYTIEMTLADYQALNMRLMFSRGLRLSHG